jgi:Xaa-Pro aminopeptidase
MSLVSNQLGGSDRIAIGDHTRAAFLVELQQAMPDTTWSRASELTGRLRVRKDPAEVEALRAAAHAVDRVLGRLPTEVPFAGRTERDVAGDLADMTLAQGHQQASFTIVAAGPNAASPHHEPGSRVIEEGDLVVCDFGGRLDGYCSDVTRTFSVGEPAARMVEAHQVVSAANQAGRRAVRPGVPCQEIDRVARQVIEDAGLGEYFIHRTGHGIGLDVHEHPYLVEGNDTQLEAGMAFSIEPGVYVPGDFGVRIEDIVVCTPEGVDELNRADRGLLVVA